MSQPLPKPLMRNLLTLQIKRSFLGLPVTAFLAGFLYKKIMVDRKLKKEQLYYQNYDAEASLKRMNDAGLMESCNLEFLQEHELTT